MSSASHAHTYDRHNGSRPRRSVLQRVHALTSEEGRLAAIEPLSGDYFLGDTLLAAIRQGRKKYPGAIFYVVRVGRPAAYVHHGGLRKARR